MSFSFGTSVAQPAAASSGLRADRFYRLSFIHIGIGTGFSFSSTPTTSTAGAGGGGGFNFNSGATSTPAPAAGSGGGFSFGSSTGGGSAAAPATSSGFNFGGGGATSTAARSLFGSTPGSATAAPATSSGFSFGTTPAAAPATGSLFGGGGATGGGSSLFGGTSSTAAPATGTGTGGGFFGSSGATTGTTGTGSSFFGAPATNTGGGSSLFGSSALTSGAAAPGTAGSFGLFGGTAGTPQQNGQGITLETPFESLPEDVKKNIVEFHKFLKEEDQSDAFLKTVSPRKLDDLNANIQKLEQDVLVRRNVQDRQATSVHHLRKDVKNLIHQVDNATLSMRTLDGNSASNMYNIMRHVETPSPYYWELLDHFERKMEAIKSQIEDIESEYKPLYERREAQQQQHQQHAASSAVSPALLHQILVAQNASLMQVAARVAEVHERAEVMRQQFLIKMRQDLERHGEHNPAAFKNPFDKRKKNANEDKRETIDKIRFRTSVAPTIVSAPAAPQPQQMTGFGGFGAAPATSSSLFGSAPGTSAFGTTTAAPATTTGGSSLFGNTSSFPAAPAPASTGGGFGFGSTTTASTAPKQVSFNLSSTAPAATTAAAPSTMSAFSIPSVSTAAPAGGFGSISTSFFPGAGEAEKRAASSKRLSGRPKKRA